MYELSRPDDGSNVGQNIILEINAVAHPKEDTAVFEIRKENSGMTAYTLSYDDGDATKEIARFINDSYGNEREDGNLKAFRLDLIALPSPIGFSNRERYVGPLFGTHVHLVGSKDIKNTRLQDERLHTNSATALNIFTTPDHEHSIGLIGFLPVAHNRFDENGDDSIKQPY